MSSMRGMSNPGSSVGGFVSTVGGTSTSRGASGGSQMPMSAKEKLQRAQKLFTDSHSSDMVDRQVAAIMRICEQNQAGLLLQDLENLHPIVTLCNERIAEAQQHEFVEPLCQLLRLCMEPFLVTGVTEDERCSGALSQLLKSISRCLYCPVPRVQLTAAAALMPFVHVTDPDQEEKVNPVGARRARLQHKVLDDSGMMTLTVSVLDSLRAGRATSEFTNVQLEESMARLMREVSASPQGCDMLVQAGAVPVLAGMMLDDFADESVACAVQVLWNVLDMCAQPVWEPLVTKELVLLLSDLFGRLLSDGFSDKAKDLRNDVLLVATLCARVPGALAAFAMPFNERGSELQQCSMLTLALAGAVGPTLGKEHPVLAKGRVAQSRAASRESGSWHQLELMKWTFNLCAKTCTDGDCLANMLSDGLLPASMSLLEPAMEGGGGFMDGGAAGGDDGLAAQTAKTGTLNDVPTAAVPAVLQNGWGPENARELQEAVIVCLTEVAPGCPEEFHQADGVQATLMFLLNLAEPPAAPPTMHIGTGPTTTGPARDQAYIDVGGGGGVAGSPTLRAAALSLLVAICQLPGFAVELGEYGAVPIMLGIIQEPVLPNEHQSLGVSIEQAMQLRQDALCVLSALCNGNETNQRMVARERGVGTLRNLLTFVPEDPDRSETLLVAALDALWSAVDGSPRNAARFLAVDGMGALLALLESSPAVLHGQILGCIADTCEYKEAVLEFLDWQSDVSSQTAVQVMVRLWRQQETKLHIADETTGYVVNQERPLAGTGAMLEPFREELAKLQDTADASERRALGAGTLSAVRESVMDELGKQDIKAKIFSVMCKCGFEGHDLSEDDHMRLAVIRRYAELKQGEVMEDIATELEEALVRPITPDAERLAAHLAGNRACIDEIMEEQQYLRDTVAQHEASQEGVFMETIKTQQEAFKKSGMSLRSKVATENSYMEQRANVKRMKQEMLRNSMKKATLDD